MAHGASVGLGTLVGVAAQIVGLDVWEAGEWATLVAATPQDAA